MTAELNEELTLRMPSGWQSALTTTECHTDHEKMQLVIELAAWNVSRQKGGPFAAAVFEQTSGRLVAAGMNVVVQSQCSIAHAEAMAIGLAQQQFKTHNLGQESIPPLALVTSGQPCIQCFGMIWWSGISRLVVAARKEDIEATTGFVEGPVPENWVEQLADRMPLPPVETVTDVCRADAVAILRLYRDTGGTVYSPGNE